MHTVDGVDGNFQEISISAIKLHYLKGEFMADHHHLMKGALVLKYQKSYDYALGDRDSEKSLGRSRIAFSMQGKVQT